MAMKIQVVVLWVVENGDTKNIWNVSVLPRHCTASQPTTLRLRI